jgi:hypothetical protein
MPDFFLKSIRYLAPGILAILILQVLGPTSVSAQVVNEKTKKRITVGVGVATDIWLNMPDSLKSRAINQGANVFVMYNVPFGKSNFSMAAGLGISTHNLYGNFLVNSKPDSTWMVKIPDSISYKRSKITTAYLELPVEFRYKNKIKLTVALGFKGGLLIGSNTKYVGDGGIQTVNYSVPEDNGKTRIRIWGIENLTKFIYGPTLRIGYRWFNVNAFYMISTLFEKDRGPDMYPITVGIVLVPF